MAKLINKNTLSAIPAPDAATKESKTNEELNQSNEALVVTTERAKESEDVYRSFYDNAPVSYQSLDENGCLIDVNQMWLTTLGYERNEVIGKWFGDLLHADDVEHFRVNFPAFKKYGRVSDIQFRLKTKNGSLVYVSYEGRIGYSPEGQFKQTYCVFKDITEQKTLERVLFRTKERNEESEEKFRQIAENIGEVFWLSSADNKKILYINPAYEKVWGCTPQSLYDNPRAFMDSVLEEDKPAVLAELERYMQGGSFDLEYRITRPDGSIRWVQAQSYSVRNEAGEIVRHAGTAMDITERKLAEAKLQDSEASVKRRLQVILEPEGDISSVYLSDLIDKDDLQMLMDDFFKLTGALSAILDVKGNVLVASGWQDICTHFHRVNPDTRRNCIFSDTVLTAGLERGSVKLYSCKNGLWDAVTPIYIGENHIGNIFFGQFFFDDEIPDKDRFIKQAKQYGFDEVEYIEAFNRVPRWNRDMVDLIMAFYARLAATISQQGYNNLQLARALSEHQLAKAKLAESEKLLSRAQEISHTGSWKLDIASNSLTWTDEVYRIFGCEPQKFSPSYDTFLGFTHPDDRAAVDEAYSQSLQQGCDGYEIEHRIVRQDSGEICYVQERCVHERDEAGVIIQSTGMVRDINDRKLAEEALRESEERFKALHNASFGGIAIHDQGKILDCNQGLSDMTGFSREELIGMDGYLLIAPESRQIVLDNVKANFEKPYEVMALRKNGDVFPIRLEARNIPYKGKSVRTVEFRDITEQKLAEKKLKESEKDLKEAQRIARLGSWHLDIATNQVEWSEELYKIYGFDPSLPPPPYTEHQKLFTAESWDMLSTALAQTAENGIPYELVLNTVLPDGTNGWMWVYGQTVEDENGVVIGLSGAAQDVTERIKAEEEKEMLKNKLNQAQKMELLGQLAGGIAHDFNNLLTVILGYSAELSSNPILDDMTKSDAEEIFKAGARAKQLTQQLLTFSRKQVVQAVTLDLNELIANLQGVFSRLIGEHIEIDCQTCTERAMVKVDRIQVEQAVINLVLNSRDAMPKGGKVTIRTAILGQSSADIEHKFQVKPGTYVLLSVSDNGCGIPQEIQSRLFEPFFTTKEKGKGLGLGLANVISIVRTSGGGIGVESSTGMGTTFTILLPHSADQSNLEDLEQISTDLNGNGELILVVEDEEALSIFFQKMICKFGYTVKVANSGAEALLLLEKGLEPDLVITDIIMPGMNGKDLADRIVQRNPEQKVMLMSGFTDDIIQSLGVIGDKNLYIQKPFTAPELALTIKTLLWPNQGEPTK